MGNIIAVDLGGSKLVTGLVTRDGAILCSRRQNLTGIKYDIETIRVKIRESIKDLENQYGELDAEALGMSIPGTCDPVRGIFLQNFSTGITNWHIADELREEYRLPVSVDNDVNACAVAEKVYGSCQEFSDYLWVTVSYGCGGALFLNGRLFRGKNYLAGEVGHIPVEHEHPSRCGCGIYGDMEAEGAGTAIGRKYLELTGRAPDPSFMSRDVSALARSGDPVAMGLFRKSGYYLGKLCAMTCNLLNIQKAVIGGGVAVYDFDLMKADIDRALAELVIPPSKSSFYVEKTALGYNASLMGAAALTFYGS